MVAVIELTQGKVAIIDKEDISLIEGYTWTATFNRKWYAKAHTPQGTIYMHRVIMKTPKHLVVHHKDNDGLHNCRKNMLNVSHRENTLLGGGTKLFKK